MDEETKKIADSCPTLKEVFTAPMYAIARTEVVEATELEIAAAIIVLKARAVRYGEPQEVKAYPFNPKLGWRQAALNFIRMNHEQAAQGNPIII